MKFNSIFALVLVAMVFNCTSKNDQTTNDIKVDKAKPEYAIVIHGGAGTITRADMTREKEAAYISALNAALDAGEGVLKSGGSSLDAVEASIHIMEESPLFNAGKGAVFTHDGRNELDASIMNGKDQKAGAVGGVSTIKSPISAARAVMEKSEHVLLTGRGAEQFAKEIGLEIVDPSYFYTEIRWQALQQALKEEKDGLEVTKDKKKGTVGCVALDKNGNIAAGTSTGGMTNKRWNRFGDAPIIGAGTFADNATCGVSCTGHGEYFIRYTVARDIAAMMEYGGKSLEEAAEYIINKKLVEKGGEGGMVALDAKGNIVMKFNSKGMYRGFAQPDKREVKIFKD